MAVVVVVQVIHPEPQLGELAEVEAAATVRAELHPQEAQTPAAVEGLHKLLELEVQV
jgi:hypothetical protein